MRKSAALFLLIFVSALCHAQNYASMWADVEKAVAKDLPKTALQQTQRIYATAASKGDGAQMLKAALVSLQMHDAVAPDSSAAYLASLDSAAAKETRPVERALFNLALARLHSERQSYKDAAEGDKALACYRTAVADMGIFAGRRADEFLPVMTKGSDAKYFNHDILNFVCREAMNGLGNVNYSSADAKEVAALRREVAHKFIDAYRAAGNSDAIILATLDSLNLGADRDAYVAVEPDSSGYKTALALTEQYPQSTCAVEAYIYACQFLERGKDSRRERLALARRCVEQFPSAARTAVLRNTIAEITAPRCFAFFPTSALYEGQSVTATLRAVNATKATVSFYRLPLRSFDSDVIERNLTHLRKRVSKPTFTLSASLRRVNDYDDINDTLAFTPTKKGVYLVEVTVDGKTTPSYDLVYVSNLRIMSLSVPDKKSRMVVVDAQSGHPVAGAKVVAMKNSKGVYQREAEYTTDSRGELVLPLVPTRGHTYYFAANGDDNFAPAFGSGSYDYYRNDKAQKTTNYKLFTDRGVYRPGQTVHVSGLVYTSEDDSCSTLYDQKINIVLRDANYKVVAEREVRSDEFGAFASDFALPQSCLPGSFTVNANSRYAISLRVEEYKRPTFEVTTSAPDGAFAIGDTVSIAGRATTFTGVGVPNATVTYSVKRRSFMRYYGGGRSALVFSDTTTTDAAGKFVIRLPLTAAGGAGALKTATAHRFEASVTVTAPDGESQFAATSVTAGKEPLLFTVNMPQQVLKTAVPRVEFSLQNAASRPVERRGTYIIYKGAEKCEDGNFTTNRAADIAALRSLASGRYRIEAALDGETDSLLTIKYDFTLFALDDKRPAPATDAWLYATAPTLSRDSDVTVQLGTSLRDVVAFYDVIADGKIIESRRLALSDTLVNMRYRYKDEYGAGAAVIFGFMRNGVVYGGSQRLAKPEPDKRLRFKWATFRNRLLPGQKEEWSLTVLNPDGTPAKASAVAALYDASLDKFAKNFWDTSLGFHRYVPSSFWATRTYAAAVSYEKQPKYFDVRSLAFDGFEERLFNTYFRPRRTHSLMHGKELYSSAARDEVAAMPRVMMQKNAAMSTMALKGANAEVAAEDAAAGVMTDATMADAGADNAPDITPRENFEETAFFMPALRTDASGNLAISFTAPESMTRWNFKLLAHTKAMNIGLLDTTTVVAKDFMVQPNMPRYLRAADKATIAATVRNLTNQDLNGTAYLVLQDAATQAVITRRSAKFAVAAGAQTTVPFEFTAPESGMLVCRITADAGSFADGEQHYLPVLSDVTETVTALPFTISGRGTHTIDIASALPALPQSATNRRLTVEYTANPLWYAIQALPAIDAPRRDDALSIASAFYATTLEQTIARLAPDMVAAVAHHAAQQNADSVLENILLRNDDLRNIVLNETPWAAEADNAAARLRQLTRALDADASAARARALLDRLTLLQQSDGGWSWFPGMQSNFGITVRVLDMLARLEHLTGETPASSVINKGLAYIDKTMSRRVKEMKELERRGTAVTQLDGDMLTCLDILRRTPRKLSATAKDNSRYLIDILAKHPVRDNMMHKALAVEILSGAGRSRQAETALQSLMEHTVAKPGMGRYFDTDLAPATGDSYKIPTHVAALEALRLIAPADTKTHEDMLTWLIQAKRTQTWSNERNTIEAVYALLLGTEMKSGTFTFNTALPAKVTLSFKGGRTADVLGATTDTVGTPGYLRSDIALADAKTKPLALTIEKSDDAISWGGIYSRALVPATEAATTGGELTISRTYLIEQNGSYIALPKSAAPKVGSRIRVRYTVTAARNFDFVSLSDARPACFEPVEQISGYTFDGGEAFYRSVRDASQQFFFERMNKGTHIVDCDYIVDRAGRYLAGTAVVQCVYSPEFTGTHKGFVINTK